MADELLDSGFLLADRLRRNGWPITGIVTRPPRGLDSNSFGNKIQPGKAFRLVYRDKNLFDLF
jgi:hypothetical protein